MVSDIAGSSSNPGAGKGIPGPLLSMVKELFALLWLKCWDSDMGMRHFISKIFNGTLLARIDDEGRKVLCRFNLRTEIGIVHGLGR